jgi:transposase
MMKAGCTYEEIGKVFGTGPQTISLQVRKYINDGINLDFFKQNRADIFASKQAEFIQSLTPEKIKKASAYQLTGMMGVFYDKERLERNLSTSNVAYADMSRDMGEIDREIRQLEAEIGAGQETAGIEVEIKK